MLFKVQADPDILPRSCIVCTALMGKPVPAAEAVAKVYGESFRGASDRIDHQVFGWPMSEISGWPRPCRPAARKASGPGSRRSIHDRRH